MNYSEELRKCKLKATVQRQKLAEILHQKGHLSIENIYEEMKKDIPAISLATVYKNVNMMVENGFLSLLTMPCHRLVYEIEKPVHSHLHCVKCHTISDIEVLLDSTKKEVEDSSGFEITNHILIFDGVCASCRKEGEFKQNVSR